jgi:hypothetical protein
LLMFLMMITLALRLFAIFPSGRAES